MIPTMRDVKPFSREELEAFFRLYHEPSLDPPRDDVMDTPMVDPDGELSRLFATALLAGDR